LLARFFDVDAESRRTAGHRGHQVINRGLLADLVASHRRLANGFQNVDALEDPLHLWLPKHRLKHAARGRGRHHVVRDALDLHLGPSEAGALTPDPQPEGLGNPL